MAIKIGCMVGYMLGRGHGGVHMRDSKSHVRSLQSLRQAMMPDAFHGQVCGAVSPAETAGDHQEMANHDC